MDAQLCGMSQSQRSARFALRTGLLHGAQAGPRGTRAGTGGAELPSRLCCPRRGAVCKVLSLLHRPPAAEAPVRAPEGEGNPGVPVPPTAPAEVRNGQHLGQRLGLPAPCEARLSSWPHDMCRSTKAVSPLWPRSPPGHQDSRKKNEIFLIRGHQGGGGRVCHRSLTQPVLLGTTALSSGASHKYLLSCPSVPGFEPGTGATSGLNDGGPWPGGPTFWGEGAGSKQTTMNTITGK